jgi:hypothetical protein
MSGRRLEAMVLTEAEKSELMALAARPKTAQALAERARIVLTWGLSGDWGDHTASAMTGDGWKPQQRGQSSAKAAAFTVPTPARGRSVISIPSRSPQSLDTPHSRRLSHR